MMRNSLGGLKAAEAQSISIIYVIRRVVCISWVKDGRRSWAAVVSNSLWRQLRVDPHFRSCCDSQP